MKNYSIPFSVQKWVGMAGGIEHQQDWLQWAGDELVLLPFFEKPMLESIPSRISRRLNTLGKTVMSCCEKMLPHCGSDPAVLCVSRHGDLTSMEKLIDGVRKHDDVSPTAFSYSVHNRFSSLVSMFAGFHGVNSATSSVRDGFPMALAEAAILIGRDAGRRVLILAYEPEIPESYQNIIRQRWTPHVSAFVLGADEQDMPAFRLIRHSETAPDNPSDAGTGLNFIRAVVRGQSVRDGFWEYTIAS